MITALLTTADLSGFRLGHNVAANTKGGCPALDTGLDPGAVTTAEVLFEKNATGPFVRERLIVYSGGAAAAAVNAVRGSPSSCGTFVVTDPNIGRIVYKVTPLSVATFGDDTAAVRLTATPESYPTIVSYQNLVVVRHAAMLIMIAHTAVGSIDGDLTNTAVSRAFAKVKSRW